MKNRRSKPIDDTEAVSEFETEEKQTKISSEMIAKIILTALFAGLSVLYWIVFYLWEFRNININFSIGELLILGIFLIPIIAIIAIALQVSRLRQKRDTKRNSIILAILVLILICSIGDTYYTTHKHDVSGLSSIYDKVEDNGKYYIVLNHKYDAKEYLTRFKCSKEIYENVIVDKNVSYPYMYIWNTLTPKTGYLVSFELNDYCDNRNNWMENYFKERSKNELSKAQLNIIKGSATVTSAVSDDAGVKITLNSVTGDGFCTYFKLDVVLPEGMNAGYGLDFGRESLLVNDDSIGLGTVGASMMTLEDGDATDNRYSVLIELHITNYPANRNYSFDNGIVRTLHLENIKTIENDKVVTLIEGQWDFDILFTQELKWVELINEPVTVSGYSFMDQATFEAEVTSFVISEFSAYCEYKITPNSSAKLLEITPTAVMKDGSEYFLFSYCQNKYYCNYSFNFPVSLDEIDYIKLTDDVILKMK